MSQIVPINYAQAEARAAGMFAGLKMSSREIAELTGKAHKHVKRDIEVLINQGAIIGSSFGLNEYKVKVGFGYKTMEEYLLDFKATMVLMTGYDSLRRAKVVDRWMELEEEKANPVPAPQYKLPTHAEALRLYADELEANERLTLENQELTEKIEEDAHKVDFFHAVGDSEGTRTFTEVGKTHGISKDKICAFLGKAVVVSWWKGGLIGLVPA